MELEGIFRIAADQSLVSRVLLHVNAFQPHDDVPIWTILDAVAASSSTAAASAATAANGSKNSAMFNPCLLYTSPSPRDRG